MGSLSASPAAFPQPAAVVEAPIEEAAAHGADLADDNAGTAEHAADIVAVTGETIEEAAEAVEDGLSDAEDTLQPDE